MAEEAGTDVFRAKITATDEASGAIERVYKGFHGLAHEADRVGHATEHMHKPHTWAAIGEHVNLAREHFGGLRLSVGEVGESITELLPALATLGAVGTFAELFETAEKTAEAYAQLEHAASAIGTTADHLQDMRTVAYLTDTSAEAMDTGLRKLNKTIAEAASGKNRAAATLFEHLHISLRDAKGELVGAPEMFDRLADSFMHTRTEGMRTLMATTLMGRSAVELVPLLQMGTKAIHAINEEGQRVNFKPTDEQRRGVLEFADEMKKLKLAGGGIEDAIGVTLAPVLTPLIEEAREFLVDVRPEVQQAIAKAGGEFVEFMQHVPWHEVGQDVRAIKDDVVGFVDEIGGAKHAVELLGAAMALKGVLFLVEPIKEAGELLVSVGRLGAALTTTLVRAWSGVGVAAAAAGAEERAAAAVGLTGVRAFAPGSAAAAEAASTSFKPNAYGQRQPVQIRPDAATAGSIMMRALGLAVPLSYVAYDASQRELELDKETIRRVPGLASSITHQQFDKLPEHIASPFAPLGITDDPAHPGLLERGYGNLFGPSPYANSSRDSSLPFKVESEVKVAVEFANAPPGTTATATTTSGQANISAAFTGQAWADHYPARR